MRTPNPPTGFSLSQICRPRPLTAPAGLYNQKLTHLRLLIDLPLLFEARPQPSITYRSLRDSYKADRDTNAQNSAGTNQFSTIGHSSYGNCYQTLTGAHHLGGPCDGPHRQVLCSQPARWAQRPWSNKCLPNSRISVRVSGHGNDRRARAIGEL